MATNLGRLTVIVGLSLATSLFFTASYAATHNWYAGLLTGYGSTNWSRIATSNDSLQATMPSSAKDDGLSWGLFLGDNINTHFGIELRYQRFANSKINFAQFNEYNPPDYAAFSINSKTEAYLLLAKLRIPISSSIELYSVFGGSITYRKDQLNSLNGFGGVFGGGTDFTLTKYWHDSLEFNFVTGNAPINLAPAEYYQPFLTAIVNKISFFF
jgi:hypothetical protein